MHYYRVHKILDDLEYVAQNMAGGSPASAAMLAATAVRRWCYAAGRARCCGSMTS